MKKITLATFLVLLFFSGEILAQKTIVSSRTPEKVLKKVNSAKNSVAAKSTLTLSGSIEVAENEIYNDYSVEQLVNNMLISGCVTTSNIRYGYYDFVSDDDDDDDDDEGTWTWIDHNWSSIPGNRQIGYFNQNNTTFPIDEGILFATGRISSAEGPNNTGSDTDEMNRQASDPDLALITGERMYDASVLEFDFVPNGTMIEFQFVFASEEYLEYVETKYNDAFGFFLSGPGISGSYTNNAVNLAELPNNDAVTINNIHSAGTNVDGDVFGPKNESYYINNPSGSSTMQYDGMTTVLTASYTVVPGQTYKIKMAIADASDQKWDAGVFLKARSFNTNTLIVTNPAVVCAPATVDLSHIDITAGSSTGLTYTYWEDEFGTIPYASYLTATEGTYYIKGYDATSGCSVIESVVVSVNTVEIIEDTSSHNDLICFNGDKGSFKVIASGGVAPYTYSLFDDFNISNTNGIFENLTAGTYTVYAKDANECNDITPITIEITEPSSNTCGIHKSNCPPSDLAPVCYDGYGETPIFWTSPIFTYNCCTEGEDNSYSSVMEFDYPESAFLANGCWEFNFVQILQGKENIRLFQSTGTVGSKFTDSYFISPAQYFDNSSGTDVNVELLDVDGNSVVWTLDVLDPNTNLSVLTTALTTVTTATNGQKTIFIPASVASGVYKLKFNFASSTAGNNDKVQVDRAYWNAIGSSCSGGFNFITTATKSPNNEFTYPNDEFPIGTTTVTYVATLSDPDIGIIAQDSCEFDVEVIKLDVSSTITDPHCDGTLGNIDLTVTGGLSYSYNWSTIDGVGLIQGQEDQSGLSAGTYIVEITDINSCTASETFELIEEIGPDEPTGSAAQTFCLLDSPTVGNLLAVGQSIKWYIDTNVRTPLDPSVELINGESYYATQTVNGCESDYFEVVVTISSVEIGTVTQSAIACLGETATVTVTAFGGIGNLTYTFNGVSNVTGVFLGIEDGSYNYSVSDTSNCASATGTFTVVEPEAIVVSTVTQSVIDCKEGEATVTIVASGGTGDLVYTFDGVTNATGIFANVLAGSNYQYSVTDANECASATGTFTVVEPEAIFAETIINNVSCYGASTGTISLNVNGGTAPYTYMWSNGSTTKDLSNIVAGNYSVEITDSRGCILVKLGISIVQPAKPISVVITKENATTGQGCIDGTATAIVSGGTAPYTVKWSSSANNQIGNTATNLESGTHIVTVTDAKGCVFTQGVVIDCTNTCDAIISVDTISDVLCKGSETGSTTVSTSSESNSGATFTFTWNTNPVIIESGVTSSTINNLKAGVYTVSVKIDGTVCLPVEQSVTITEPSTILNVTAISTNESGPTTSDGTASVDVIGGTPPYTYLWSTGTTSKDIEGLSAGLYSVIITDANGCEASTEVTVSAGTCLDLTVFTESTSVTCNELSDGTVTATVTGGSNEVAYLWSNGETTASIENISGGTYTVTVTDLVTLCEVSSTVTVNEPNELSTGIAISHVLCANGETGSLDLTVSGGTFPYSFVWSNGSTSEDLNSLKAGSYDVIITDANGCEVTASATIEEPEQLSLEIVSVTNANCDGDANGEVTVTASGGISPYFYTWSNDQTGVMAENLAAGTYSVEVIDANGCSVIIEDIVVTDSDQLTANAGVDATIDCNATSIQLIGGSSDANAVYSWTTDDGNIVAGANTSSPEVNASGTYILEVSTANGCSAIDSVVITLNNSKPTIDLTGNDVITCEKPSIILDANGSISDGGIDFMWSTNETSSWIEINSAGDYTVTLTDKLSGCSSELSFTVIEDLVKQTLNGDSIILCLDEEPYDLTQLLGDDYEEGGTWTDDSTSGGLSGNFFDPSIVNLDAFEFTYTEPGDCGRLITVFVTVDDSCVVLPCSTEDLTISKVVTPNNDGHNDNFELLGLEGCGFSFNVQILNRWGKVIFESENYQNDWKGISNTGGSTIGSSTTLPTGTYYYIVSVTNSGFDPITGYIYLGTR